MNYKKVEINISNQLKRRFFCIFNRKEQLKILDEMTACKRIYTEVDDNTMLETIVSKNIKQKIHHIVYLNINHHHQ